MQIQKIIILVLITFFNIQNSFAQCNEEGHSTNSKDSWLSCETAPIPNSNDPANYHWIYYDLGYAYQLGTVKLWNYNVLTETGKGIKDGEIFYSVDGQNWTSGGIFQLPEADGQSNYDGWEGIDLKSSLAQFITIAAYNNWSGEPCIGLSEVRCNISNQTTSVKNNYLAPSEMLVFPNPTNQTLSIRLKNNRQIQELILINNAGHEVIRRKGNQSDFSMDVSLFPAGMYYVKIVTNQQEYLTTKFVKTDL